MIWYDMIWYDMIWYDMIWYDMIYTTAASEEALQDSLSALSEIAQTCYLR